MDTELTTWLQLGLIGGRITMTDETKALLASDRVKKAYLGG